MAPVAETGGHGRATRHRPPGPTGKYSLPPARHSGTISTMNPHDQAIEEARRAGFDLNLIDCNLALAPEERALRHDMALEMAQELRKAGERFYAQSASASATVR